MAGAEPNSRALQTLESLGVPCSAKSVEKVMDGVIEGVRSRPMVTLDSPQLAETACNGDADTHAYER